MSLVKRSALVSDGRDTTIKEENVSSTFKRLTIGVSMALVGSLAVASVALADGQSENFSRVTSSFTPNLQSNETPGAGSLFTQVETYDANGAQDAGDPPVIDANKCGPFCAVAQEAEQVRIDFDDDIKLTINSKLGQCTEAQLAGDTTAAAIDDCDTALIGSGSAHAMAVSAPPPAPAQLTPFTVTVFNGPTSVAGGACDTSTDSGGPHGCEFSAGNPTLLLHARLDALNQTVITPGQIITSPAGGDFGKRLDVTDAPDVNSDNGSLNMFNAVITRKYTNGKTGDKKKVYQYSSATCDPIDAEWDFQAEWEYDDQTTDTDTHDHNCLAKENLSKAG
jgi:hypothetical protein